MNIYIRNEHIKQLWACASNAGLTDTKVYRLLKFKYDKTSIRELTYNEAKTFIEFIKANKPAVNKEEYESGAPMRRKVIALLARLKYYTFSKGVRKGQTLIFVDKKKLNYLDIDIMCERIGTKKLNSYDYTGLLNLVNRTEKFVEQVIKARNEKGN